MNLRAMSNIRGALNSVQERIRIAWTKSQHVAGQEPRLVAVSKTKPVSMVLEAYRCGQRHFGENYTDEMVEKGQDPELMKECSDICWHYIGRLQRNGINKVLRVPNLYMIETLENERYAAALNSALEVRQQRLKIMVQVNTSGEHQKRGCKPEEAISLVQFIIGNCPAIDFVGLMTIGAFDHDLSQGPNPDFQCLLKCRENVCKELGLNPDSVELSMGMSGDFEHAIEVGSTNVRVGSIIFGARPPVNPIKSGNTSRLNDVAQEASNTINVKTDMTNVNTTQQDVTDKLENDNIENVVLDSLSLTSDK